MIRDDRLPCSYKEQFEHRTHATKALRQLKKNGGRIRGPIEVYKCRFCDGWHYGNRHRLLR